LGRAEKASPLAGGVALLVDEIVATPRRAHDPHSAAEIDAPAPKRFPELEREVAHAQQRHDAVCTPANQSLQARIREARTDVERLDAQAVIRRIERLRQRPPTPSLGPDRGISL